MKKFTLLTILMLNLSVVYSQNYRVAMSNINKEKKECKNSIKTDGIEGKYYNDYRLLCSKIYYDKLDSMLNVVYRKVRNKMTKTDRNTLTSYQKIWLSNLGLAQYQYSKEYFLSERVYELIDFNEAIYSDKTKHYEYTNGNYNRIFSTAGILLKDTKGSSWKSYYSNGRIKEYEEYREGEISRKGSFDNKGNKRGDWFMNKGWSIKGKGSYKNGVKIGQWDYSFNGNEFKYIIDYSIPIFKQSILCIDDSCEADNIFINSNSYTFDILSSTTGDLNNDGYADKVILIRNHVFNSNEDGSEYIIGVYFGKKEKGKTVYHKNVEVRRLFIEYPIGGYPRGEYNVDIINGKFKFTSTVSGVGAMDDYGYRPSFYYRYEYSFMFKNSKFVMDSYYEHIDGRGDYKYDLVKGTFTHNKEEDIKIYLERDLLLEDIELLNPPDILTKEVD